MHLPLTFGVLAALAIATLLLRWRWDSISRRAQQRILLAALIAMILRGLGLLTNYSTSFRIEAALNWLCLAGYGILLARFSLMRPRWLTSTVGAILALPVLAATVLLPLTELFDRTPPLVAPIGNGLYSELRRIQTSPVAVDGAEFNIYSHPAWAPFLRRRRETARLFDTQCDTHAMYAVLQPGGRTVRVTCPEWPGHPAAEQHSVLLPLR